MRLSPRVEKDWFISDLIAKGAEVEFWDVTHLLFPGLVENFTYEPPYQKYIHTYDELNEHLKHEQSEKVNFVIIVTQEARFYKFFRMLQKYNFKLYYIHWGVLPSSARAKYKKIFSAFNNPISLIRSGYYKVKAAIYTQLKLIKPFDVVFAAGGKALSMHGNVDKVVPINLNDYEKYVLTKKSNKKLVNTNYAVFLDINLPYQSDLTVMKLAIVNPESYYASLNNYFDQIENKHNIKVVIAAHPSAKYAHDTFNGRLIYTNLTPELVKDCSFVISHHSTSLSFAILNKKPIVFVYTAEMLTLYKISVMVHITNMANFLDAALINIDSKLTESELAIKEYNPTLYDAYKYNYLTTYESEFLETKEIFTQILLT